MLSCDCSSISRFCSVLLSSLTSERDIENSSCLVVTVLFSSSNCGERGLRSTSRWLCTGWLSQTGLITMSTHFGLVPGLHFSAVLLGDAFILLTDLLHDAGQVLLRCGVNLHVYAAGGHLSAKSCELLQINEIHVVFHTIRIFREWIEKWEFLLFEMDLCEL